MADNPIERMRAAGRRRFVIVVAICMVLGSGYALAVHIGDRSLALGTRLPELQVVSLTRVGGPTDLREYQGQVVLVDFWATYCASCFHTFPALEGLYREYGGQGLRVVAVSIDHPSDSARAREMISEQGLTFDLVLEPHHRALAAFALQGIPHTLLFGKDGTLRWQQAGFTGGAPDDRVLGLQSLGGRRLLEAALAERDSVTPRGRP